MSEKKTFKEKSALEVTKDGFWSKCRLLYDSDENLVMDDCRFEIFTSLLEDADEFENSAVVCRGKSPAKSKKWGLLGYTRAVDIINSDYETDEPDDEDDFRQEWRYSIINGFFEEDVGVVGARKLEIDECLKGAVGFIEKCIDKDLINDTSAPRELQDQLIEHLELNVLARLEIYIITDKVINQEVLDETVKLSNGEVVNVHYWDLKKWDALKRSRSKRVPIEVDFAVEPYSSLTVDYVKKAVSKTRFQYLAIFPGELIYRLYDRYGVRLLENNVRVFLSAKKKANLEMRNTIKDRGGDDCLFFSFNNGLSITAEKIEFTDERISKIKDFQIVNGGQTTATIHYCRKRDKYSDGSPISLENVFVPVKITEIQKAKDDEYKNLVSKISRAANTQSGVKQSDFYANDPLLVKIERLAKRTPVNSAGKNVFYFFERMSGQYNVAKGTAGNPGTKAVRIWEKEHPAALRFNKIDVTRWYNCMNGFPHVAADGAEKQFVGFMKKPKSYFETNTPTNKEVSLGRMKSLLGFGVVFKRFRKLVGTKTGKAYPSLIDDPSVGMSTAIYASCIFHELCGGRFDYWAVFDYGYGVCRSLVDNDTKMVNGQLTPVYTSDLDAVFRLIIKESWKQLKSFGGTSVQEQTKKEACWEAFKKNFNKDSVSSHPLDGWLITPEELDKRHSLESQNECLKYFEQVDVVLANNHEVLRELEKKTSQQTGEYRVLNKNIKRLIKRITGGLQEAEFEPVIKASKVEEVFKLYKSYVQKGIIKEVTLNKDEQIYPLASLVFTNFNDKKNEIGERILKYDDVKVFEENAEIHNRLEELEQKFNTLEGLPVEGNISLEQLKKDLLKLKKQNII